MKIGIIVYSETGNTLSVAEKLIEALRKRGEEPILDRITTVGKPNPSDRANVQLDHIPDVTKYDALVFASPVQAFSLAVPMFKCIGQIAPLDGRKTALFLTQHFPYPWLGGNRGMAQLEKGLLAKGALIGKAGIVNWSNKQRAAQIEEVIENAIKHLLPS